MSESPVDPQGPQFGIQRIYVKDVSFEVPRAPEVFTKPWQPKMKMDINSRAKKVEDNTYEVVLTLSIEARDDEDQVGFIVELSQAGIFFVEGVEGPQLQHTLSAYCPSLLFPYARSFVDTLVTRGSFPALMLAHVNFDALYNEALKQQAERQGSAPAGDAPTH
jgi:preprotein translocase subunit SecB